MPTANETLPEPEDVNDSMREGLPKSSAVFTMKGVVLRLYSFSRLLANSTYTESARALGKVTLPSA